MKAKDTFFCSTFSLNCRGRLIEFNEPAVMGIVNLTPDSFYTSSRAMVETDVLKLCEKHLEEGAKILDLGGCSTRPGSEQPSEKEERGRVFPLLTLVRKHFPEALISIDTYRSVIAEEAVKEGADLINDISGWTIDPNMLTVAGRSGVPYVLSHIRGTPETMHLHTEYNNVLTEVAQYFTVKAETLRDAGVKDIILDPGFGFAKSFSDNYRILNNLDHFTRLGFPVMAGLSRKGMIQKALDINAAGSGDGTTVANTVALLKGASIIRVHDAKPAMDAVRILRNLN